MADKFATLLDRRLHMVKQYEDRTIARYSWSGVLFSSYAQSKSNMPMTQWKDFVHWVRRFRPWMINGEATKS